MYIGGDKKKGRSSKFIIFFILAVSCGVGIGLLLVDINRKKVERELATRAPVGITDDNPSPHAWGSSFPLQLDSYLNQKDVFIPTPFGGSLPYSKLIRYPQLVTLWAGSPFGLDFNEERHHFFSFQDQRLSKRVDAEFMQQNGLESFKGQPATCLHCHSAWAPKLLRSMGHEKFHATSYKDMLAHLKKTAANDLNFAHLGSSCSDCHSPKDMSLRITREHYIATMVERGFKRDPDKGLKASHQEMRTHVCAQCHTEYYFATEDNSLRLPWKNWPKDKPFLIEYLHEYYQNQLKAGEKGFRRDWNHQETGAPMIKIQHPETEMYNSGSHSRSGVACADCHMPYAKAGARKYTDHSFRSPLFTLQNSCLTCHSGSEEEMRRRVIGIQKKTAASLQLAENAIMALIQDIQRARPLIEKKAESDNMNVTKLVNRTLANARMYHRHASMRWDFVFSENSTGFHSPQESMRIISQAIHYARRGQLLLLEDLSKLGLSFTLTANDPKTPPPPKVIRDHEPPVGSAPPQSVKRYDEKE